MIKKETIERVVGFRRDALNQVKCYESQIEQMIKESKGKYRVDFDNDKVICEK